MGINTLIIWQVKNPPKINLSRVKIFVYCQVKSNSIWLLTRGQLAINNHKQKSINSLYLIVAYFPGIVNTYKKRLGLQNITGRSWHFVRDRDRMLAKITTKPTNNPHKITIKTQNYLLFITLFRNDIKRLVIFKNTFINVFIYFLRYFSTIWVTFCGKLFLFTNGDNGVIIIN